MTLSVYTIEKAEQWDAIVHSFQAYDVYYLSGYVKAFQLHGDGDPLLFYYENDDLRGINVVMKRDIANDPHFAASIPPNTYFDFSTPYGYGGWLLEGEGDVASLFAAYESWCGEHWIVSEFVRFHPVLQNQSRVQDFYEVVPLGGTIAMDVTSPDTIWANLTSKNRNMIRKAQKSGVKIYSGRCPPLYETFREIYNATMDKDNAASYYYFNAEFYNSLLNDLPQNAQVFYAQLDETIIAASIVLRANDRLNYHLSGSRKEYQNLAPTNLLLYEAALWGCANGCKTLHLGGGVGAGEDSLYAFKKTFYRGKPCHYHIGKRIFLSDAYEKLITMRTNLTESGFFPRYRA